MDPRRTMKPDFGNDPRDQIGGQKPPCGPFPCPYMRPQSGGNPNAQNDDVGIGPREPNDFTWPPWLHACGPFPCPPPRPGHHSGGNQPRNQGNQENVRFSDETTGGYNRNKQNQAYDRTWPINEPFPDTPTYDAPEGTRNWPITEPFPDTPLTDAQDGAKTAYHGNENAPNDFTWPPWLHACGPFPCPPPRPGHHSIGNANDDAGNVPKDWTWPPWLHPCGPFPCPPPRPGQHSGGSAGGPASAQDVLPWPWPPISPWPWWRNGGANSHAANDGTRTWPPTCGDRPCPQDHRAYDDAGNAPKDFTWPPWLHPCGPFPCPPPRPGQHSGGNTSAAAGYAPNDNNIYPPTCGPFPCPPYPKQNEGAGRSEANDQTARSTDATTQKDETGSEPMGEPIPRPQTAPADGNAAPAKQKYEAESEPKDKLDDGSPTSIPDPVADKIQDTKKSVAVPGKPAVGGKK